MLNFLSDEKADVKEFKISSFLGDVKIKNDEIVSNIEFEHFIEGDIKQTTAENNIVTPEYEDFSLSLSKLFESLNKDSEDNLQATSINVYGENAAEESDTNILTGYERVAKQHAQHEIIISKAEATAAQIISQAKEQAQEIELQARKAAFEDGYNDGFKRGQEEGYNTAFAETQTQLSTQTIQLLTELKDDLDAIQEQREAIFQNQIYAMRDLSIAIAEKIVNVSLKSSSEIIEKMIISATEKIKDVKWIKLYVSQLDFETTAMVDVGIINAIKMVTENVKIEIMQTKPKGTCIIELPDQIIDTSVDAQIEQVKNILSKV